MRFVRGKGKASASLTYILDLFWGVSCCFLSKPSFSGKEEANVSFGEPSLPLPWPTLVVLVAIVAVVVFAVDEYAYNIPHPYATLVP